MLAIARDGVFVGVVPTVRFGDRIPGQVRSTAYQSQLYAAAGWTRLAERAGDGQGEEPGWSCRGNANGYSVVSSGSPRRPAGRRPRSIPSHLSGPEWRRCWMWPIGFSSYATSSSDFADRFV